MATEIQLRRDTKTNWTTNNPILALGEKGIESDTNKEKNGNGVTPWNGLPYCNDNNFTDALKAVLSVTLGTNTGDETATTIKSKLNITTLSGSNSGDETNATILNKLGFTPASTTIETRTLIGGNGSPAFLNSWVNYGTPNRNAGYYKDQFGIVHLEGCVKSGTIGTAIFTLPSGYTPTAYLIFPTVSNSLFGQISIDTSGNVIASVGNNASISLDGISFRI